MKASKYLSALSKEEYEAELEKLQIKEKAVDFYKFLSKYGKRI